MVKSLIRLFAIETSFTIKSRAKPELNFSETTNLSNFTSVVLFLPVAPLIIFKNAMMESNYDDNFLR